MFLLDLYADLVSQGFAPKLEEPYITLDNYDAVVAVPEGWGLYMWKNIFTLEEDRPKTYVGDLGVKPGCAFCSKAVTLLREQMEQTDTVLIRMLKGNEPAPQLTNIKGEVLVGCKRGEILYNHLVNVGYSLEVDKTNLVTQEQIRSENIKELNRNLQRTELWGTPDMDRFISEAKTGGISEETREWLKKNNL